MQRNPKDTLVNVAKTVKNLSFAGRNLMSTAQMMVALEMAKSSLVQAAGRSPIHSQLTRMESAKTKLLNELHQDAPNFDDSLLAINKTLSEVAKNQSNTYSDLIPRLGGAKQEIDKVKKMRQALNEALTTFASSKDQVSSEVRNSQTKGKTATDIRNKMEELQQTLRKLANDVKNLKKEERHALNNLDALHADAFNSLPPTARGSVPLPRKEQEAAQQRSPS